MTKHYLQDRIGFNGEAPRPGEQDDETSKEYINLKLAARGFPIVGKEEDFPFLEVARSLILNFQERLRLLEDHRAPVDTHISDWLAGYLEGTDVFTPGEPMLPNPLMLERHGLARLLSLPAEGDKFESDIVSSYRTWQGVCHNPAKDKRTTKGVFHVAEGGLPIAADKLVVPKQTFAAMLKVALNPPEELMVVPFTSQEKEPVKAFVSLMLRPVISPEVPEVFEEKTMETRFFAPGNLVSNLDFVESIFGNAGDPYLPENDARLDVRHWSGHTGCVILAPHLTTVKKKDVGLPHISEATDQQKAHGMCWESEDELYNNGSAFKLTARDAKGVVVTLIADNYFGYYKKEVKTQISYAANLYGLAEEEHAGGALVFPSFDLGEHFSLSDFRQEVNHTFREVVERYGDRMELQPEGYSIDKAFPSIFYIPEDAYIDLRDQSVTWKKDGEPQSISLQPERTYVLPSGYKVEMRKPSAGQRWRLVGTNAEGTFCHKPCTVSGGGKSEISKSLSDAMQDGPVIMPRFEQDMFLVEQLLKRDYGDRFQKPNDPGKKSRGILDPERSLGSVMRLFSQSDAFTDEYNEFISTIPRSVRDFILTLKRYWKESWGDDWRSRFRVDSINGESGVLLKYRLNQVMTQYLRVGYSQDESWRMFGLRKDFVPSTKLQREDDITASITIPAGDLDESLLHPDVRFPAYKFATNCEYRLFQRPDDAIHRGYDKQTELDFSKGGNFFSNYEPKTREEGKAIVSDSIRFEQFTAPLKKVLTKFTKAKSGPGYMVSSAHPRIVDGVPTANPRYLQNRPDLENPRSEYLGEIGSRLYRRIDEGRPVYNPVHAVLPGRRNNPGEPDKGIRALAVFGPLHYQELPELFMDFVASLTGKSPSTTGAGSEGALTKGPFNALLPVVDLNAAMLSYLMAGYEGFSSAAGYIGPKFRVDHDISLLVPEVWSRMFLHERCPKWLIEHGFLEEMTDFEEDGETVYASRLGYRITSRFVKVFFGRMFSEPSNVFSEEMLRPELQDYEQFVDGIKNITETHQKVAMSYFEDGGIDLAIPPLKALLHIMAHGDYEGKTIHDPEVRELFDREKVLASDWYQERLEAKKDLRMRMMRDHIVCLEEFLHKQNYALEAERLELSTRLDETRASLADFEANPDVYLKRITGSIGVEPSFYRE
ncbi:MAG: hypothetical protein P1U86_21895 [Verrucomicrobiales bacterium]|nr:hypothetical protein [Verrucomicrobiales bacterium]